MKKLILIAAVLVSLLHTQVIAQEMAINNASIEKCLVGTWNVVSVQPNDKATPLRGFSMKGAGYGELITATENNTTKKEIGKYLL